MPSEKILQEKQAYVEGLAEKLKNAVAGVVVSYQGLNVADDTQLRRELRAAGVEYAVVKNTLLRRACDIAQLSRPGRSTQRHYRPGDQLRSCGGRQDPRHVRGEE